MIDSFIILGGKILSVITKNLNLGNGSTWPGHIALKINSHFIIDILKKSKTKTIVVAGTNGKTTTSKLIATILESNNKKVLYNDSGANLLNGIASSLLLNSNNAGELQFDYALFEADENALPLILSDVKPDYLILLNLFRDQLDRYGEVNTITTKWKNALEKLDKNTIIIINADDPQITYLGYEKKHIYYFSTDASDKTNTNEHALDSTYCPRCNSKLIFSTVTFSHLGNWRCLSCKFERPTSILTKSPHYPLPGKYNEYNTNAAVLLAKTIGISLKDTEVALKKFTPAFGRQEQIVLNGKKIQIFLSKNPTGFNESLRTVKELGGKHILFILNDRIPDGQDISWIWDTDIENILKGDEEISISGDRAYDMTLRIKYSQKLETTNTKIEIFEELSKAIRSGLSKLSTAETLYIIPTYSAMLEVRKILTGKKIL